jgi:hypothetical protein
MEIAMRVSWAACLALVSFGCSAAFAAPDCRGVLAKNAADKKVARITCSNPNTPGTAATYTCTYQWKMRAVDGVVRPLKGEFALGKGEANVVKFEDYRVDGHEIDDEVEGVSVSCATK